MPSFPGFLTGLARALMGTRSSRTATRTTTRAPAPPTGSVGADATVEVDPHALGRLRLGYSPLKNAEPDPGEIVWTWVPYAERDGRGKDRPVLIVAAEPAGTVLAVALTSKDHDDDARDFVPLGVGPWDVQGRPSWVNIQRVFRVHPAGMRREAAALDAARFTTVASSLRRRYGWSG